MQVHCGTVVQGTPPPSPPPTRPMAAQVHVAVPARPAPQASLPPQASLQGLCLCAACASLAPLCRCTWQYLRALPDESPSKGFAFVSIAHYIVGDKKSSSNLTQQVCTACLRCV